MESESKIEVTALLASCAKEVGVSDIYDESFATAMDAADPLKEFRSRFCIPKEEPHTEECKDALYFCGNSLGLMPKRTQILINEELEKWKLQAVEGHFNGDRPWAKIDEFVTEKTANLVGATPSEVAVMNTLSVNLHLLMISFFRPTATRHKIMIEADAFCSDHHVVRSQLGLHGLTEDKSLIQLKPREGEYALRTEDIIKVIEDQGDEIALIMLGGVNFYTGQFFELEKITKAGHAKGCKVGFDCAHAFGNVPLKLHDWGVDWAAWCTYKYLNSGPGCIGGVFVHEKHNNKDNKEMPILNGWWGQTPSTRFAMKSTHDRIPGAQAWMLSNPPVLPAICLLAALEIHNEAGIENLRHKSFRLTGYLEALVKKHLFALGVKILTPSDPTQRGCQLSLLFDRPAKPINQALLHRGALCDVREPNVIRVSPAPLYNTFTEVFKVVHLIKEVLSE